MSRSRFMERISRERAERALSRYPRRPTRTDAVANALADLRADLRDVLDAVEDPPADNDAVNALRDLERRVDELEEP